jgi:hypothetical protein
MARIGSAGTAIDTGTNYNWRAGESELGDVADYVCLRRLLSESSEADDFRVDLDRKGAARSIRRSGEHGERLAANRSRAKDGLVSAGHDLACPLVWDPSRPRVGALLPLVAGYGARVEDSATRGESAGDRLVLQ